MKPSIVQFDRAGVHRLIPARYSESGTVLAAIAEDESALEDIILLDGATNDRVQGEEHGLSGISTYELIYGIPNARIVNSAFTHANPEGSRFNDGSRGAWYAASELRTSIAEVAYHKARRLAEIVVPGLPGERPDREVSAYDDWLADFRTSFHALVPAGKFSRYLRAEPVPACYAEPQRLAKRLLAAQSNGVVYPSVRRPSHLYVACFRPALVYNVRRGSGLELEFVADTRGGYRHRVIRRQPV